MFKDKEKFIRGQRQLRLGEVQGLSDQLRAKADKGFWLGGVWLPSFFKTLGVLLLGVPGSGKSLTMKSLMVQCFKGLISGSNSRGVVYDFTMEFFPFLKSVGIPSSKLLLFHGNHKQSVAWDIQGDILNVKDCIPVAFALIPPNPRENNPFFTNGARNLLIATLQAFHILGRDKGIKWTLKDVFLALGNKDDLKELLIKSPTTRGALEYNNQDVRATLEEHVKRFQILASVWRDKPLVSIREWMKKDDGGIIVIGRDKEDPTTSSALARVLINRIGEALQAGPRWGESRTTWFFLDELPQMIQDSSQSISDYIATVRAYGGCFITGIQSIPQLFNAIGEQLGKTLLELLGTKAIFHVEQETAKYVAERIIGSYEVKENEQGTVTRVADVSFSNNERVRERVAVHEQELASLPLANSANPTVSGYYLSASLNNHVWYHRIPFGDYGEALNSHGVIDNDPETDPMKFELQDWTETEREAIGLSKRKYVTEEGEEVDFIIPLRTPSAEEEEEKQIH